MTKRLNQKHLLTMPVRSLWHNDSKTAAGSHGLFHSKMENSFWYGEIKM